MPRSTARQRVKLVVAIIVNAAALVVAFALGRASMPSATVSIERSPYPGWIEVYRHGELSSEWHRDKDPDLWPWLDRLLRDDEALYDQPAPGVPRRIRGRGPELQQARR